MYFWDSNEYLCINKIVILFKIKLETNGIKWEIYNKLLKLARFINGS